MTKSTDWSKVAIAGAVAYGIYSLTNVGSGLGSLFGGLFKKDKTKDNVAYSSSGQSRFNADALERYNHLTPTQKAMSDVLNKPTGATVTQYDAAGNAYTATNLGKGYVTTQDFSKLPKSAIIDQSTITSSTIPGHDVQSAKQSVTSKKRSSPKNVTITKRSLSGRQTLTSRKGGGYKVTGARNVTLH